MNSLYVYLILKCNYIICLFIFFAGISGLSILALLTHIGPIKNNLEVYYKTRRYLILLVFMFIVFVTLAFLTPGTKTAIAIYLIPKISNNETLISDLKDIYNLPDSEVEKIVKKPKQRKKNEIT